MRGEDGWCVMRTAGASRTHLETWSRGQVSGQVSEYVSEYVRKTHLETWSRSQGRRRGGAMVMVSERVEGEG